MKCSRISRDPNKVGILSVPLFVEVLTPAVWHSVASTKTAHTLTGNSIRRTVSRDQPTNQQHLTLYLGLRKQRTDKNPPIRTLVCLDKYYLVGQWRAPSGERGGGGTGNISAPTASEFTGNSVDQWRERL